jgi:multidrug transporter EmrE-like cation transporter
VPSSGERTLAAEAVVAIGISTIGQIRKKGSVQGALNYGTLAGITTFYTVIAGVALFGDKAAKFSASLGGLVLIAIGISQGPAAIAGVSGLAAPKAVSVTKVDTTSAAPPAQSAVQIGQTPGFSGGTIGTPQNPAIPA